MNERGLYLPALFGGGAAGLVVDIVLFPLDTIKTRLQAENGFRKSGGFKGIYRGIGPQVIGSAPQAALFFCTYESFKFYATPYTPNYALPLVHMVGASLGETVACLIRVPMEVVKQRRQVSKNNKSSLKIMLSAYRSEGFIKGLYRGFGSTVIREVPFSFIQLPILEYLKSVYRIQYKNNITLESQEVAVCGAIAGGISAAVTTPLDVIKTRIMLADKKHAEANALTVRNMMKVIYQEKGIPGLFAGFAPRVMWITIGGYIFFGVYDFSSNFCRTNLLDGDYDYRL